MKGSRGAAAGGAWLGLLIVGQAASLRLIEAGPVVRYQHYLAPARMAAEHPVALALVLLWMAVTLAGSVPDAGRARVWVRARFRPAPLLLAGGVGVAVSAGLSLPATSFVRELAIAATIQLTSVASALLAARSLGGPADGAGGWFSALLAAPGDAAAPGGPDRLAWILAGLVTLAAAALNLTSYQAHPHIPDEVAYLAQARYFAHGMLAMPAPPVPAGFDLDLFEYDATRWYSIFPPGWPAVLAIGARAGVPWLVNPVVAGVTILVTSMMLREFLAPRTARLAVLLLALSPWHLFLGMSFMSHSLSLLMTVTAALAVLRMRRTGSSGWGWVGGAAIGLVSVMRPLEGVAVAGFLGVLALTARGRRFRFAPAATLAAGAVLFGLPTLFYNRALTGRPLAFPVLAYFDRHYAPGVNALGFGANRGLGWRGLDPLPGHGPLDVLINAALNGFVINVELFGWAAGSLLPIALLAALGRPRRSDLALWAAAATIALAHSFYWFSGGPDFGARYWFLMIVPLVALAARAIERLGTDGGVRDARPLLAALALSVAALVTFVPWRAVDKYRDYRGMRPDVRALAATRHFGNALVLVRGHRHPDYASAATYNPLDVRGPGTIYAWDKNAATRRALLAAYPDRAVWVIEGPSLTGGAYRVVAGPLAGEGRAALDSLP